MTVPTQTSPTSPGEVGEVCVGTIWQKTWEWPDSRPVTYYNRVLLEALIRHLNRAYTKESFFGKGNIRGISIVIP